MKGREVMRNNNNNPVAVEKTEWEGEKSEEKKTKSNILIGWIRTNNRRNSEQIFTDYNPTRYHCATMSTPNDVVAATKENLSI